MKTVRVVPEYPSTVTGVLTSSTKVILGMKTKRGIKYFECNEYGLNCRRIKHFAQIEHFGP